MESKNTKKLQGLINFVIIMINKYWILNKQSNRQLTTINKIGIKLLIT